MTVELLKTKNLEVKGIVFNGAGRRQLEEESMDIILKYSGFQKLLVIEQEEEINLELIKKYAKLLKENWHA